MQNEISLSDAMKEAGVVQKTIWTWCQLGHFKWRKAINRRLWIDRESFLLFIKSKEKQYNTTAPTIPTSVI